MIAANNNPPARASNGVSLARVSGMPDRPAPVTDPEWEEPDIGDTNTGRGSCPMYEAFENGLFDDRYRDAIAWWHRHHAAQEPPGPSGGGWKDGDGVYQPFHSRAPDELYGAELAAEVSLARKKVYGLLGVSLVAVMARATEHAEMADLAPTGLVFPREKRALAGRIRLGAAMAIICGWLDGTVTYWREAVAIKEAAADSVMALVAKRRLRADNDNLPAIRLAA